MLILFSTLYIILKQDFSSKLNTLGPLEYRRSINLSSINIRGEAPVLEQAPY
jgi:hypothetical protein